MWREMSWCGVKCRDTFRLVMLPFFGGIKSVSLYIIIFSDPRPPISPRFPWGNWDFGVRSKKVALPSKSFTVFQSASAMYGFLQPPKMPTNPLKTGIKPAFFRSFAKIHTSRNTLTGREMSWCGVKCRDVAWNVVTHFGWWCYLFLGESSQFPYI